MTAGWGESRTTSLLAEIAEVGRDPRRGGYSRHGFSGVEAELLAWFTEQATRRGLDVTADGNGNLWAWWGARGPGAVVTGSHLDSVPGGGGFDGPLGVATALDAVDMLRANGFRPTKPLAVAVFTEEEGGRFGVPCLGSKLLTGAIDPNAARRLTDADGVTLAEAARAAGADPTRLGPDDALLADVGVFVELHVEQGRRLDRLPGDHPVALASSILAHGRWRFTVGGQGNHAGTTDPTDRHDPMLPAAAAVLAARRAAAGRAGARATVGRLVPNPGGTNVIASSVDFWLDARAPDSADTRAVVADITAAARDAAAEEGCTVEVREESYGDTVTFDPLLRETVLGALGASAWRGSSGATEGVGTVPVVPTGAGHDAGVLAARVPTAMLFVRNPTGVSHAPAEHAEPADCAAGARALATVLQRLCR